MSYRMRGRAVTIALNHLISYRPAYSGRRMVRCRWPMTAIVAGVLALVAAGGGAAQGQQVGTSFPSDFPVIIDASLGVPVIGFGASGPITRTPVIFLHGNIDTPYPTTCNSGLGKIHEFAQYFLDHGYAASELWGLGYQGDQCDLLMNPTNRSGEAHSTVANVPDLDRFVRAVLAYTGARRVDIVGHSLGGTLAREWIEEDHTNSLVGRLVAVDSPNHGVIMCSPSPLNYWQEPALGGYNPDSALCREYGSDHTPMLTRLNRDHETRGSIRYLTIRNADTSFVYFSRQDGLLPSVPAQDRDGLPHDFSQSARLEGVANVDLVGQGQYDGVFSSAHLGIVSSPDAWQAAFTFLARP